MTRVVIIGAGQAGARAALALRQRAFSGTITLVGDEQHPPYERPPLSKDVLVGRAGPLDARIGSKSDYMNAQIRMILGRRVRELDTQAKQVILADGDALDYDKLIVATGARAKKIPVPGAELNGVYYIRNASDASRLRAALTSKARSLVVIGGGFLGLEVAASARALGLEVTVLEQAPTCLGRVLPPASAQVILDLHHEKGANVRCGVSLNRIAGDRSVRWVEVQSGDTIAADIVVVGIGSLPNAELARAAGIECAEGVLTDFCGRTSDPDVYAIGDISQFQGAWTQGRAIRLESWENAERQGRLVATLLSGGDAHDSDPPWFWTDQYGWNVQLIGLPAADDTLEVRPGSAAHQFCHLYIRGNRLAAAVLFNLGRERRPLTTLIAQACHINPAILADPTTDLRRIA